MPKVIGYTPRWLSRGSPGFEVFTSTKLSPNQTARVPAAPGQSSRLRDVIAHRGTEVFFVSGNEIRWSDLVLLQEKAGDAGLGSSLRASRARLHPVEEAVDASNCYRVLKVPISSPITQLSVSPSGDYMAIVTSHTIHIAVLPDSSLLDASDAGPLKLRTFQLGPTAHVLEQTPIASVLWHPLGHKGHSIVTITTDAIVRLWELNDRSRASFSEPALAVDLKKLANATNAYDDVSAGTYGIGKGFSPDLIELEVAAACFGSREPAPNQHPWAPMTLWIATREGDLYALCPFLPSSWQWSSSVKASSLRTFNLSAQANADSEASEEARRIAKQQLQWLVELEAQEVAPQPGVFHDVQVQARPASVPTVPKLQGPFELDLVLDEDVEICDVFVSHLRDRTGPFIKQEFEDDFSDVDAADERGDLPAAVICLLTSQCQVYTCLDFDGVEAQWLPKSKSKQNAFEVADHEILVVENIILRSEPLESTSLFPSFTADIHSDHSFFVTDASGIYYVSLLNWIGKLEEELGNPHEEGVEFRLKMLLEGPGSLVENIVTAPRGTYKDPNGLGFTSSIILKDADIGYFLLATYAGQPVAATLDCPDEELPLDAVEYQQGPDLSDTAYKEALREVYNPPQLFWQASNIDKLYQHLSAIRQESFKQEIKLSPATLDTLTDAHRLLSTETYQLGLAAADLFRRCERLQNEFRDRLKRASELALRIDKVAGNEGEYGGSRGGDAESANLETRLERAKERQAALAKRHEALRKKALRLGGKELSAKEKAWVEEVEILEASVIPPEQEDYEEEEGEILPAWKRYEEVKKLKDELVAQAKDVVPEKNERPSNGIARVPESLRRQRVDRINELLDREAVLVDSATEHLHRLTVQCQQADLI